MIQHLWRRLTRREPPHTHGHWYYTLHCPEGLICGDCGAAVVLGRASDTARCFSRGPDGVMVPTDWPEVTA